ncbi:MAG TPA: DUF2835 domain-containing protein [Methylophaga sp.]|nr:DUF2835 domain-containing protein [Methylophaga sp.]
MDRILTFKIRVGREEAMRYYRGEALSVRVITENGQTLQFPALHIRRFINQQGINGRFQISFDANNKLKSIERIG